jgi:hypothetical protein
MVSMGADVSAWIGIGGKKSEEEGIAEVFFFPIAGRRRVFFSPFVLLRPSHLTSSLFSLLLLLRQNRK